jgi:hypothetical protein
MMMGGGVDDADDAGYHDFFMHYRCGVCTLESFSSPNSTKKQKQNSSHLSHLACFK